MPVHLDQRLLTVARLVRQGAYLADIGTDHGYLPVYLVQTGRISRAIAADINENPLKQAVSAISAHGLDRQIKTVLSDGLKQVDDHVEDIVIAGMGGELIGSIISAVEWLKNPDKRLILQPMTQDVYLREYLAKHNTQIMSWGPFAEGKNDFFNTPVLKEIGAKYGKSVAQVALRFLLQNGVVVIPKSTHEERMQENFNVFDFVLTDEEMKQIEVLDTGKSLFFSHYSPETVEWFMSIV